MSQDVILKFLEKREGERFTAPQLKYYLGLGMGVYRSLKRLRLSGEVQFDVVVRKGAEKAYEYWL